jgi:hypothetical protein
MTASRVVFLAGSLPPIDDDAPIVIGSYGIITCRGLRATRTPRAPATTPSVVFIGFTHAIDESELRTVPTIKEG